MQDKNLDIFCDSYDFELPPSLIALTPIAPKEKARLLIYKRSNRQVIHSHFANLFDFIPRDYLVVLNESRVIPARFFGTRLEHKNGFYERTNSKREFLYHKPCAGGFLAWTKGRVREGDLFITDGGRVLVEILSMGDGGYREIGFYSLESFTPRLASAANACVRESKIPVVLDSKKALDEGAVLAFLEEEGSMPLPPYIKRAATKEDCKDYQSIFARVSGSIAAPTASLHFSKSMLAALKASYEVAFVTLHVGAGTFSPLVVENILEHRMHAEFCALSLDSARRIAAAKKILCVGTTALRCVEWFGLVNGLGGAGARLEDAWQLSGENEIFLHPLNRPRLASALLTNFHLPKSTLLMLVSSLIGRAETLRIYNEALSAGYRFYSYGDGMLII